MKQMDELSIKEVEAGIKGANPPLTTYLNNRRKGEDDMSRSSFSSVNSSSLKALRDHARVLNKESFHGNSVSKRIIGRV